MGLEATTRDRVEVGVWDEPTRSTVLHTNARGVSSVVEEHDDLIGGAVKVLNGIQLLTSKQLCMYLHISRSTLYNIRKRENGFPEPIKVGVSERLYWRRDAVDEWLKERNKGVE